MFLLTVCQAEIFRRLFWPGELSGDPQVIIADQPTRGVDVGATEFIRKRLVEAVMQETVSFW